MTRARPPAGGTVYFVRATSGGPIKIGYTEQRAHRRVSRGGTFSAAPLEVLIEVPGTPAHEAALLAMFDHARVHHDWFAPTLELMELIAALHDGVTLASYLAGTKEETNDE